jgi:hypothetical protein
MRPHRHRPGEAALKCAQLILSYCCFFPHMSWLVVFDGLQHRRWGRLMLPRAQVQLHLLLCGAAQWHVTRGVVCLLEHMHTHGGWREG